MPVILSPPLAVVPVPVRGWSRLHQAVDWPARVGTPVLAPADGLVTRREYQLAGGLMLHIDHGEGVETNYAHLSVRFVSKGERVRAGQQIALTGASGVTTGPHLHFGVRVNGTWVDPEHYLGRGGASNVQPAPSDRPAGYPLDAGKVCDAGYSAGTVNPQAWGWFPGSPWFGRPTNSDGTVNACIRAGVEPGANLAAIGAGDAVTSVLAGSVPLVLNIGIVLAAVAIGWAGVKRILEA